MKLSPAMKKALHIAANRERGNICPIPGVHAAAEEVLLRALLVRGLAEFTAARGPHVPLISAAGREAAGTP